MNDCLIAIPTYCEKENIAPLLERLLSVQKISSFDLLFIDDNSPDQTAQEIKKYISNNSFVYLLQRFEGRGFSSSLLEGFEWAIKNEYKFVIVMDADLSHAPEDIPQFYNAVKKNPQNLCVGTRYLNGIRILNWSFNRLALSLFANKLARLISGVPCSDLTSGFNAYSTEIIDKILSRNLDWPKGYAFQIKFKFEYFRETCSCCEIPITFYPRLFGFSKFGWSMITEALWGLLHILKLRFLYLSKTLSKK
jgi:dolichol-phosphate mannosyltransferase